MHTHFMPDITWRQAIREVTNERIVASIGDLDQSFNDGFGGENGPPFVAWTETLVLFPICYDGAEWAGSAPRNPTDSSEALEHQGGG